MITVKISPDMDGMPAAAIAARAQELLDCAPVTPTYRSAIAAALALPGNILSNTWDERWARLVWNCSITAGEQPIEAVTIAAAVELFMVALDVLDDLEDNEENPLSPALGPARTLNVSTGLLLMVHSSLLATAHSTTAARILIEAGLAACSGQHLDLQTEADGPLQLDESLAVTAQKSASLVSAICRLGALCGGADESKQLEYARFGWNLGMVLQLTNDIAGIHPKAQKKTDAALARPTLPLTYATLFQKTESEYTHPQRPDLWTGGPAFLTWSVAEVYRRYTLDIIPDLTLDPRGHTALAKLIPMVA